ncbi:hypothetical protein [Pseudomonas tohonis]|uniref:hypothetical protein n=1 Tax=Pseudomonas tohonis TaxID=2725477 RepID=UPI001F399599|nr:hypothetical protein [Pseudomonas tohonis]
MSASRDSLPGLPVVTRSNSAEEITLLSDQAGGVIIRNFLTPEQVVRINDELEAPLAALDAGSKHEHALVAEFHAIRPSGLPTSLPTARPFAKRSWMTTSFTNWAACSMNPSAVTGG